MDLYRNRKEKITTIIVFAIYLGLLCWLVLFKFATNVAEIPHVRGINLIPFYYDQENSFHVREVLYNMFVFIPAGFYFTVFNAKRSVWLGTAIPAALSVCFETVQWIFAIGGSDITDVLTNTFGGFLGMCMFLILGKVMASKRMKVINSMGIIIEIVAALFITLLFLSN